MASLCFFLTEKMANAEIITIGTEILLGEIVDTNARYIARCLRDLGVDMYRVTTVGDNQQRIAQAISQSLERIDIVITTGGLGPTVDDPTREAVALAFGVELAFHPELWAQIEDRFRRLGRIPTDNNRQQAYLPVGAIPVENPVGTAPSFIMEHIGKTVISLPGVPYEMEYILQNTILPYLRERYKLEGIIKTRLLHTAGVGESQIDALISDLELMSNPTVGLAAHSGQVDVRITTKAGSEIEADEMISLVEEKIRSRLKDWIYGTDNETIEEVVLENLRKKGWKLMVLEAGLGGILTRKLADAGKNFMDGVVLGMIPEPTQLQGMTAHQRESLGAEVGLGVAIYQEGASQVAYVVLLTPDQERIYQRTYGSAPGIVPRWVMYYCLNLLRGL